MRYGLEVVTLGDDADPRPVVDLALAAEAAGWDGRFVWDHLGFAWGCRPPTPGCCWRRLWEGRPVTRHGDHDRVEGVTLAPLPVQRPRIPVWIGGDSPPALRRAARWDGWATAGVDQDGTPTTTPERVAAQVAEIRRHRTTAGAFDAALTGRSEAGDTARTAFGEAGVTWWLESLHGFRGPFRQLRARVAAGPPGR